MSMGQAKVIVLGLMLLLLVCNLGDASFEVDQYVRLLRNVLDTH